MTERKSSSKKRKRDLAEDLEFKLAPPILGSIGPTLVSYPAFEAPSNTAFQCFAQKKSKHNDAVHETDKNQNLLLVAETDAVEFVTNEDETQTVANSGCHYLLALHNRRTGSLSMLPTVLSPHILKHNVKALKSIPPAPAPTNLQYREARIALGETFGTKKAKAAIKAQERNRVDVGAMEGVMSYVMDGIEKGAEGLMTVEEAKTINDNNRLIPPFSTTATDPSEVYPLHDIIPEAEWKALSVSAFDEATSEGERKALLPYRHSSWISGHLRDLVTESGKAKKKNLKILLYISAMLAFRQAVSRKDTDKDTLGEKMIGVPSIVVDSLFSRFTEVPRGSTNHQATSATKTSLLTHILTLCLKVDNYAANAALISQDLSMKTSEVNQLFKSLGCKITQLGERERIKLGLSEAACRDKRAVLNAPVQFPKPKLRRKT